MRQGNYEKQFQWTTGVGAISALAWSPDNQLLAATSLDGFLQIWDASNGHVVNTMQTYSGPLYTLDWRPDGFSSLATGGYDGTIRLWDAKTGREDCIFMGHGRTLSPGEGNPNGVATVKWSPDGQTLASGGYDGTVRLWDTTTNTQCNLLQPFVIPTQHPYAVSIVDWNPAGDALLSVGLFNVLPIWDAKTGQKRDEVTCPIYYTNQDPCVFQTADWSPDGTYIVASGGNGTASFSRIWNISTKESRDLIDMCTTDLHWMPKSYALLGWCDGQLQMFDADTLQLIATTDFAQGYWEQGQDHLLTAYAISPDEQHIAFAYQAGYDTNAIIQLWTLSPNGGL